MFFIIVAIEICSYITAPDSTDKNETFRQSDLSKYIDGLFMGISSKNNYRVCRARCLCNESNKIVNNETIILKSSQVISEITL